MSQTTKARTNPTVDGFFYKSKQWQQELEQLRAIALSCELTEELKWAKPCYTHDGNNIIILQSFKDFCALLFTQGSLLKDTQGVLEKPGENTQAARRMTFTNSEEVSSMEPTIKAYIEEAIKVNQSGAKVEFKKEPEPIPQELEQKFHEMPALRDAFEALTPGRQRGYILHFSSAKQSQTRASRIEKCAPKIFDGKGFNEQ